MLLLGVDIGGTKIAAAQVTAGTPPEVHNRVTIPTLASDGFETSIAQVYRAIDACFDPHVRAIGICAPGPLDPKTGVVLNPPNLPGWDHVSLAQLVSDRYQRLCRVENDANAAGLAETLFGAAQGYSSVVYVTISTGIGTGIVLNGRIYHGKNGAAGEGGHVSVDFDSASVCNCGTRGCIEVLASGHALLAKGLNPTNLSPAELDGVVDMLGTWLGGIVSLLDPEVIVIGGGMSQIGEPLFSRLRRVMPTRTINQFASETPIVPAKLATDAGVLGAASVVFSLD